MYPRLRELPCPLRGREGAPEMAGPRDSSSRPGRARAPLQLSGSPPLPGYQFLSVHHHHSSLLVDVDLSAFPGGTHSDFKTCAAVQAYTVELANAVCEDLLLIVFASSGKVIMLSLINKPREKNSRYCRCY